MKVVFISGPFRGTTPWATECNIRQAEELALKVWSMGAAVICPHTNTRFFDGILSDDDIFLPGYLEIIKRCDAIVLTKDYLKSNGAREELAFAKEEGLSLFYEEQLQELQCWINKCKEIHE